MSTQQKITGFVPLANVYKYQYGIIKPNVENMTCQDLLGNRYTEGDELDDGSGEIAEIYKAPLYGEIDDETTTLYYNTQYAGYIVRFYTTKESALNDIDSFKEELAELYGDMEEVEEIWNDGYIAKSVKIGEFFGNETPKVFYETLDTSTSTSTSSQDLLIKKKSEIDKLIKASQDLLIKKLKEMDTKLNSYYLNGKDKDNLKFILANPTEIEREVSIGIIGSIELQNINLDKMVKFIVGSLKDDLSSWNLCHIELNL